MNTRGLFVSLVVCLFGALCLVHLPACTSTPETQSRVECVCDGESPCCDGCNPVNVGELCGFDSDLAKSEDGGDAGVLPEELPAPLCGDYRCTDQGACQVQAFEGWCFDDRTDTCHSMESSPFHCGQCGEVCAWGDVCALGECVSRCPDAGGPYTDCNGSCVVLSRDYLHCPGYGAQCTSGLRTNPRRDIHHGEPHK